MDNNRTNIDMSESQKMLQTSEERFKTIFEQAPLGIALIDSNTGHIYEVNSRFAKICGRSIEEMSNIDWMQI
ncbi:MAG TPA: PAS domain-containing protein, partial [Candidatus Paceibacterota bacterium]